MSKFKIRCSAIGEIMTQPKKVKDKQAGLLSAATKNYCDKWIIERLYQRRNEIISKYTAKGHIVEDSSIEFISKVLEIPLITKNTIQYENEYLTGEPDIVPQFPPHLDLILDAKNSWSSESFPLLEIELPEKNYFYQGQGYMALTERTRYKVVYILSDAPEHLIEAEAWKKCRTYGFTELDGEIYQEFERQMTYANIPDDLRIKVFDFQRDEKVIEEINAQVRKCRAYIKERIRNISPLTPKGGILEIKLNLLQQQN